MDDPDGVKIVFKLPNDSRVERRFLFSQSITVKTLLRKPLKIPHLVVSYFKHSQMNYVYLFFFPPFFFR